MCAGSGTPPAGAEIVHARADLGPPHGFILLRTVEHFSWRNGRSCRGGRLGRTGKGRGEDLFAGIVVIRVDQYTYVRTRRGITGRTMAVSTAARTGHG